MGHVPRARRAVAVALALLRTALSGHRGQRLRLQLVVARGVPGRGWPVRHAACSDLRDAASAPESRLPESGECNESKTAAMSNLVPATQWGFRSMILGGLARCSDGVDRAPMRPCSCSACDVAAISRRACTSAERGLTIGPEDQSPRLRERAEAVEKRGGAGLVEEGLVESASMALVCRPDLQLTVANGRGLLRRARGDANAVVLYVPKVPTTTPVSPHNQARTKKGPLSFI